MGTILGRSNTAQHRHTPVNIVLSGARNQQVVFQGCVCSMAFVKMIPWTNNQTVIDYFVDYWIGVLQLNSDPLGPKDHPPNSLLSKSLDSYGVKYGVNVLMFEEDSLILKWWVL